MPYAYHKSLEVPPALTGWAGLGKSHEISNIALGFQLLSAGHSSQGESHELREGWRGRGERGRECGNTHFQLQLQRLNSYYQRISLTQTKILPTSPLQWEAFSLS